MNVKYCYFCHRNMLFDDGTCYNCFKNFYEIKPHELNYVLKLKYFNNFLLSLSSNVYNFPKEYLNIQNANYEYMIQFIPLRKRKSILFIHHLFKNIKQDNRILNNEMIDILLKYYYYFLKFIHITNLKLNNMKYIWFIIRYFSLNYEVYVKVTNKDLFIMQNLYNFIIFVEKKIQTNNVPVGNGYYINI